MANNETKDEESPSSGSGMIGKLIMPLMAFLNLGFTAAGIYLVFINTVEFDSPKVTEETEQVQLSSTLQEMESDVIIYQLDPFTVNLAGFPTRAIRLELNLELLDSKGYEEVVKFGGEARDAVVKILNAKRFQDIETIQGKLFLKDQVATTLNGFLKEGVVKDVYFTEFIVQ